MPKIADDQKADLACTCAALILSDSNTAVSYVAPFIAPSQPPDLRESSSSLRLQLRLDHALVSLTILTIPLFRFSLFHLFLCFSADNIAAILAAAGFDNIEGYYPKLFASALEGKDIGAVLFGGNAGSSSSSSSSSGSSSSGSSSSDSSSDSD